jgi:hypothetical protein
MDTLMKALTVPLTDSLKSYKQMFRSLHPYEETVANLTVTARVKKGLPSLDDVLGRIKALRAATSRIGKEYASKGAKAETAIEARALLDEGMEALQQLYTASVSAHANNPF